VKFLTLPHANIIENYNQHRKKVSITTPPAPIILHNLKYSRALSSKLKRVLTNLLRSEVCVALCYMKANYVLRILHSYKAYTIKINSWKSAEYFSIPGKIQFESYYLECVLERIELPGELSLGSSHFHTDWLTFEGLATKVNLNQIQKYFVLGLLGPKPIFWDLKQLFIWEKSHIQSAIVYKNLD
jgi:hypothetical protein